MNEGRPAARSLRKSIAIAFERKLVEGAMRSRAEDYSTLRETLERYLNGCTSDMRGALSGALRRLRLIRNLAEGDDRMGEDIHGMEAEFERLWVALTMFVKEGQMALGPRDAAMTALIAHAPSDSLQ